MFWAIHLDNGDDIFTEIVSTKDDVMTLCKPYKVFPVSSENYILHKWAPFSDDIFIDIDPKKVYNLTKLSKSCTESYGMSVLRDELEDLKDLFVSRVENRENALIVNQEILKMISEKKSECIEKYGLVDKELMVPIGVTIH